MRRQRAVQHTRVILRTSSFQKFYVTCSSNSPRVGGPGGANVGTRSRGQTFGGLSAIFTKSYFTDIIPVNGPFTYTIY